MKGVGGLQGRKQERKIRTLSGADSSPLSPTRSSTQAALEPSALCTNTEPSRERGRIQGRSHSLTQGEGTF